MRVRPYLAGILMFTLLSPSHASAYPQDPNNCHDSTITWYFNTGDWYGHPTARARARAAIDLWEQPLDYNGSRLMTVNGLDWGQHGGSGTVEVLLADDWEPTRYGHAECTLGATVQINETYRDNEKFMWKVARHEMGHLAGFHHSGRRDSWNVDDPPTMATCIDISAFRNVNELSQDDAAYATWSHSNINGSLRPLVANLGFEQGLSYWGVSGGTVELLSTGGATGPGHVRYKTSQSSYYLYQTVNLAAGNDDEVYFAAVNYRQPVLGGYGSVTGTLFRKRIDYPGDNGCDYADGLQNLNEWVYESGTTWLPTASTGTLDPTIASSWTYGGSAMFDPTDSQGYVFQYRVYSHSQTTAYVPQWVHLDNLRAEGT